MVLLVLATSGCAQPVDVEAEATAIRILGAQVVAAVNANDAAALTAFVTDDVVWMPPNEPAVIGKEAFQAGFSASFDEFTFEVALHPKDELVVAGDWAFARGRYTLVLTPKAGGEPTQQGGKFIDIYQRQPDGSWKYARHIWNVDQVEPSAATE
jgi:uncharacterized protein (TIGR02246 family)